MIDLGYFLFFLVNLLGGNVPNEGNVFAHNPVLNKYGPVCDSNWEIKDVSKHYFSQGKQTDRQSSVKTF